MPWSPEQQLAIDTYNKNILVAAAAGSGKTSVLVERIIQRILRNTCNINEILVVTFTNAAANEMHERIAQAISELLPSGQREQQLILLNSASISTLHSFCQNILRQYFYEINLDPQFRLGNPQEIDLLRYDVLDEVFEQAYNQPNNQDFLNLTDIYGSERGDDNVYELVLRLFNYSRSQPFSDEWIRQLPQAFAMTETELTQSPLLQAVRCDFVQDFARFQREFNELRQLAQTAKNPHYLNILHEDELNLGPITPGEQTDWQALRQQLRNFKFKRLTTPKDTDPVFKELFTKRRNEVKQLFAELLTSPALTAPDELLQEFPALARQASALCELTLQFAQAFAEAKAKRNLIDFTDLEHFTLAILTAENSTADHLLPSPVALALQKKYKEIMVDEYQDTNGVQEAIIQLLASPNPNLFFVGDVKQSIYKFRLAEPELFLDKYSRYPEESQSVRIDLAKNFRSRKEIIDGVNFIFKQLMKADITELDYGEQEALVLGLDYPEQAQSLAAPIELHIFERTTSLPTADATVAEEATTTEEPEEAEDSPQGFYAETAFIIERLRALMDEHPLVYDKHTRDYRPLKWRDIVILLRSVQTKAKILADSLRDANIPVYASVDSGYFAATEVKIMLSLLQVIDNPQQDIPLTAVLYSPIVGLTSEQLVQIRLQAPKENLYQALIATTRLEASHDIIEPSTLAMATEFIGNLERWRDFARRHSVPELIWRLLSETGYYDYVGGLLEGSSRQANLRALYDCSLSYEQTSFRGLFRFLRFINKMKALDNDLAVARNLGESEDVVRIMSIHKSKGLEFPVVFIPDLGKKFNLSDAQNDVLFHKKLGMGMYLHQAEYKVKYPTLSHSVISKQIIKEAKAEELRVLYVAMTRARERLILSGTVPTVMKFASRCCGRLTGGDTLLPDELITRANTYLDWLGPALARHPQGGINLRKYGTDNPLTLLDDDSRWQVDLIHSNPDPEELPAEVNDSQTTLRTIAELKPLPASAEQAWVDARLQWRYQHLSGLDIPTKLSVTEIKQKFIKEMADDSATLFIAEESYRRPQFIQEASALTGSEYGTLMHTVMQHLDLSGDLSRQGITQQLQTLVNRQIILAPQLRWLSASRLSKFFTTPLAQRLLRADWIERELHFNHLIQASRLYPQAAEDSTIFVQGVIDLIFGESDGIVIIDYKTDNCSPQQAASKYAIQLQLYSEAASRILASPVKEQYLYLFHSGEFVQVNAK